MSGNEDVYKIKIIDEASRTANNVQAALSSVAATTNRLATAMLFGSAAEKKMAREGNALAASELKAARAQNAYANSIVAAYSKTERAARKARAEADKAAKARMRYVKSEKTSALDTIGKLGLVATAAFAAAAGGYAMGRSFLEAAGTAEAFERTFARLAPGELKETRALIQKLGLDLEAGEEAALKLRTTFDKFTSDQFLKFFAGMGLGADEIKRASLAISQIQGRGKLQAEELNQFVEAVPGVDRGQIIDKISKELKISLGEASKRLGKGQIAADVGIRALYGGALESRKLGGPGELDKEIEARSGTLNVKLTNVDNSITRIKRNLGEALAKGGFLDDIIKFTTWLEKMSTSVDKLADSYKRFKALLGIGLGGDYSQSASYALGVDPESATGKVLDYSPNKAVADVGGFLSDIWKSITEGRGDGPYSRGVAMGQQIPAGIAAGITQNQGKAIEAVQNLGKAVDQAGKQELQIKSPSRVFAQQGKYIDEGLAVGINDHADVAFQSAQALAEGTVAEAEMQAQIGASVSSAGMMNIGSAAGNALTASTSGAGATIGTVSVSIQIDGAEGPSATVEHIRTWFDTEFAALLERNLEGSGAS